MRHAWTVAALAAGGLLAAGAAAPAAMAADDCPNAAVRAQQQSQHLPNCMAYEKVTLDEKSGEAPGVTYMTEDGNGTAFTLNAGIADAQSFAGGGLFRSLRSPDGSWSTTSLSPAMSGPVLPALNAAATGPHAATPDLARTVLTTTYALDPNDQGVVLPVVKLGTRDVFLREADGSFRWLVPDPTVPETSLDDVYFAAASLDLERVVVGTSRQWDPRVDPGFVQHLYVWSRTGTHLVTVLPNGDLASALPVGSADSGSIQGTQASTDARRIAFLDGSGSGPLYVRFNADDPETAFTREVGVPPAGESCSGASNPDLSADGKQIVYGCFNTSLPGGPANRTYIRDLDGGPDAVRLLGEGNGRVEAANADFSRVYLSGLNGDNSLYLMRDGGEPEPVVTPVSGEPATTLEASADGEYVAFTSSSDFGLEDVDHSTLTGPQTYLYAARTDELTCVSCRRDGNPTEGPGSLDVTDVGASGGGGGNLFSGVRPVSTSGTVTFSSNAALVAEDTNGQTDAYAWADGRAVLLSGGQGLRRSASQGGSADGSSLFFRTTDALVPDDRDGGQYDLYAARVNGGTLLPVPPTPPCTANCQGPAPERPGLPGLGSTDVLSRGNLIEDTTKTKQSPSKASLTVPRSVRGSSTSVRVKVSRAGSIRVSGAGLSQRTVTAKKAGTYRVTVRLSAHGAKQQRSRGRLATRVTLRFTPQSGAPVSSRKSVTFTAKKGGR